MKLNFEKSDGLIPAIVQHTKTNKVLMLGYMNEEALAKTKESGKVTFFSRTRDEIWTKGETSDNFLMLDKIYVDCDDDTLLIKATPTGPVCHTGDETCFKEDITSGISFLNELEELIAERKKQMPEGSYTTDLFNQGITKIAQKVGEEAVEVVIDAVAGNDERLKEECADLIYHFLVLLVNQKMQLNDIVDVLRGRHK